MAILISMVILLGLGVWDKYKNTLHMRRLAREVYKKHGGPKPN